MGTRSTHVNVGNKLPQTHAEFNEKYLTYSKDKGNWTDAKPFDSSQFSSSVPFSIDWRTKGAVGSVKNQVYTLCHQHELRDDAHQHELRDDAHMLCTGSVWS